MAQSQTFIALTEVFNFNASYFHLALLIPIASAIYPKLHPPTITLIFIHQATSRLSSMHFLFCLRFVKPPQKRHCSLPAVQYRIFFA
jgi:hypothetical protein